MIGNEEFDTANKVADGVLLNPVRSNSYVYDPVGRLEKEAITGRNGEAVRTTDFTYDRAGNRLTKKRTPPRQVSSALRIVRNLSDISSAGELRELRHVQITKCPKVVDLTPINSLSKLEILHVDGKFEFEDLEFFVTSPN